MPLTRPFQAHSYLIPGPHAYFATPRSQSNEAFPWARLPTPFHSVPSPITTPVSCVRAFVTSLLHLFHAIRHDLKSSFFLSLYWGSLIYLNKRGRVGTHNLKLTLFIHRHGHRLWFLTPRNHRLFLVWVPNYISREEHSA